MGQLIGPAKLWPLLLTLLLTAVPALATTAQPQGKEPIQIEADHMVSLEGRTIIRFTGNVVASQGEVTITSREMIVHYKKNGQEGARQIDKLECRGQVEMTRGDWRGTGDRLDYLAHERKVIISGQAQAWQGDNLVAGEVMHYYLDEGRSEVFGNNGQGQNGRVQATIIPR